MNLYKASEDLENKHNIKVSQIWLAVPCVCKQCATKKGFFCKTTFYFINKDTDETGLYCIKHGLFTKTGIDKR